METTAEIAVRPETRVASQRASFFDLEPDAQLAFAAKIATSLQKMGEEQKLYSNISGKKYPKVEFWQTMGNLIGVSTKERRVIKLKKGGYKAEIDIFRIADGKFVGSGSAICTRDERSWSNRDEYAVRSMAITRATGKAFRSAFAWIATLAGYEGTPAEEMPEPDEQKRDNTGKTTIIAAQSTEIYTGTTAQQNEIKDHCIAEKISSTYWPAINDKLMGKPFTKINIGLAIREAMKQ